jgi:hypothetical protein
LRNSGAAGGREKIVNRNLCPNTALGLLALYGSGPLVEVVRIAVELTEGRR